MQSYETRHAIHTPPPSPVIATPPVFSLPVRIDAGSRTLPCTPAEPAHYDHPRFSGAHNHAEVQACLANAWKRFEPERQVFTSWPWTAEQPLVELAMASEHRVTIGPSAYELGCWLSSFTKPEKWSPSAYESDKVCTISTKEAGLFVHKLPRYKYPEQKIGSTPTNNEVRKTGRKMLDAFSSLLHRRTPTKATPASKNPCRIDQALKSIIISPDNLLAWVTRCSEEETAVVNPSATLAKQSKAAGSLFSHMQDLSLSDSGYSGSEAGSDHAASSQTRKDGRESFQSCLSTTGSLSPRRFVSFAKGTKLPPSALRTTLNKLGSKARGFFSSLTVSRREKGSSNFSYRRSRSSQRKRVSSRSTRRRRQDTLPDHLRMKGRRARPKRPLPRKTVKPSVLKKREQKKPVWEVGMWPRAVLPAKHWWNIPRRRAVIRKRDLAIHNFKSEEKYGSNYKEHPDWRPMVPGQYARDENGDLPEDWRSEVGSYFEI